MSKTDKGARFTHGKAIRHAEQNTSEESYQFMPWKVTLGIVRDNIDPRAHEAVYYVRAPYDPGLAAQLAHQHWVAWEKRYWGLPDGTPYPDTQGEQFVDLIDEQEWFSVLGFARSIRPPGDFMYAGPEQSPSVFAYWEAGRVKPGIYEMNIDQLAQARADSIIIP